MDYPSCSTRNVFTGFIWSTQFLLSMTAFFLTFNFKYYLWNFIDLWMCTPEEASGGLPLIVAHRSRFIQLVLRICQFHVLLYSHPKWISGLLDHWIWNPQIRRDDCITYILYKALEHQSVLVSVGAGSESSSHKHRHGNKLGVEPVCEMKTV